MPEADSNQVAPDVPDRRSPSIGAASTLVVAGIALLLGGMGLGLLLSAHRAPEQGAYAPPVIPGRAARVRPPRPPVQSPAPEPRPVAGAAVPANPGSVRIEAPPAQPEAVAVPEVSFAPPDSGLRVVGGSARDAVAAASALLDGARSKDGKKSGVRWAVSALADPPLDGARAVVVVEGGALRVGLVAPPSLASDPVATLLPPRALASEALSGVRLEVGAEHVGAALASLGALLGGDADRALSCLDGAGDGIGVRILGAYAHLLRGELPAVHARLLGLGSEPEVGPVARFLTGAALLLDGNPREALRDLSAAVSARPSYWPARLLAGAANDRLALPEAARDAYAAVLAAVPGRPEAVVGYAPHLAIADRPAAVSMVERLLAERPALVSAWWQLAWLRRTGGTSEDLQKEVDALEHVVASKPDEADAFGALGGARSRWAAAGGGVEAYRAASVAFARQCELTPDDGLAWFNRAATLHQVALETPLEGDRSALARRVAETASIYLKALARGLARTDAARVHFNLGLLLDAVQTWPEKGIPPRGCRAARVTPTRPRWPPTPAMPKPASRWSRSGSASGTSRRRLAPSRRCRPASTRASARCSRRRSRTFEATRPRRSGC